MYQCVSEAVHKARAACVSALHVFVALRAEHVSAPMGLYQGLIVYPRLYVLAPPAYQGPSSACICIHLHVSLEEFGVHPPMMFLECISARWLTECVKSSVSA
jgi:hypothetical protein